MTTTPAGTYGQPHPDPGSPTPPERARGRRTAVVTIAAVGTAMVIGGGAYAVTRAMGGGGDQPAAALPAGAAVYVRLDIDPGVGQKLGALRFLEGLDDEALESMRSGEWRERLFTALEEEDPEADWSYEEDLEPWLGDRLGLAVVPDGDDTPLVAVAVQVKRGADVDVAAEVEQLAEDGLFGMEHGDYVVLTGVDDGPALEDALASGTLADDATFMQDMEALGGEGVASMWMDLARVQDFAAVAEEALGAGGFDDAPGTDPLAGFLGDPDRPLPEPGRTAAAIRFADDSIELHGIARGFNPMELEAADTAHLVMDLPAGTAVAVGAERGDQLVQASWDVYAEYFPEELAEVERSAREAGFELPGDLGALLGDSLAIAVGPDVVDAVEAEDVQRLPVAYQVATGTERAEDVLDRLLGMGGVPDDTLVRDTGDGVLTVGLDQGYVQEVAAEGRLGEKEQFTKAVADAEDADGVVYVDINAFEDLYLPEVSDERARTGLENVAALGWSWAYTGDSEAEYTFRLVADPAD